MTYKIKRFVRDHETIMLILSAIYRFFGFNKVRGRRGLEVICGGVFVKHTQILNHGSNNRVIFDKGCRVYNCKIQLFGNDNVVYIDHDCVCKEMDVWISNGARLNVGHNTHFTGKIHIACIEGKTINIGERCLFSNEITFRSGDSHVITDLNDTRINPAEDISVGDHTWIGNQVVILKGANIGTDSVVGTRSLVTGKTFPNNAIIAGSPAKVIKENITWRPE